MNRSRSLRIGIIADTHGLFDSTIVEHFECVNHIIHAGDIGKRPVIEQLEAIAPVTAVSGNVDEYEESGFPREIMIELAGLKIVVRHVLYEGGQLTKEGRAVLDRIRPDICIFGHTHRPKNEWLGDTLLFNPGSAGPKRFKLPRGLGLLTISEGKVSAYHVALANRAVKFHSMGRHPASPPNSGRGDERLGAAPALKPRGWKC